MNPPRKEKAARTSCCGNTLLAGWLPSAKVHHRKTNRRETSSCRAAPPLGEFLCVSGSQKKTWRLLVKNNRQLRSWRLLPFQVELINQLLKSLILINAFCSNKRIFLPERWSL